MSRTLFYFVPQYWKKYKILKWKLVLAPKPDRSHGEHSQINKDLLCKTLRLVVVGAVLGFKVLWPHFETQTRIKWCHDSKNKISLVHQLWNHRTTTFCKQNWFESHFTKSWHMSYARTGRNVTSKGEEVYCYCYGGSLVWYISADQKKKKRGGGGVWYM